jgi:hypothetical protein
VLPWDALLLVESLSHLKQRIRGSPSSLGEDSEVGGDNFDGWKP